MCVCKKNIQAIIAIFPDVKKFPKFWPEYIQYQCQSNLEKQNVLALTSADGLTHLNIKFLKT